MLPAERGVEVFLAPLLQVILLGGGVPAAPPTWTVAPPPPPPPPVNGTLIQQANLVFQGAFRVPSGTFGPDGDHWDYGGQGLTFDPTAGTFGGLFSSTNNRRIGEVLIPDPATWSTSATIGNLPTASMTQGPQYFLVDDDNYANDVAFDNGAGDTTTWHGDCFRWPANGLLYCTDSLFYDGSNQQGASMFTRSANLNGGLSFSGWIKTTNSFRGVSGTTYQHPTAGYIAAVPAAYQASLGKAIVGSGGNAIISGTSNGPSAFIFDPDTVAFGQTIATTAVLWYTHDTHPTIGLYDPRATSTTGTTPSDKPYHWTGVSQARAAVIPTGWQSLLVMGRGTGNYCYGFPTTDPAQDGVLSANGVDVYCYDTEDNGAGSVGVHSSDRDAHLWAYDLNDLVAVKNGTKNPWDVLPYANFSLTLPTGPGVCTGVLGVGQGSNAPIGAATGTIAGTEYVFVSFEKADKSDTFACKPLIGVYKVQ